MMKMAKRARNNIYMQYHFITSIHMPIYTVQIELESTALDIHLYLSLL